MGDWGRDRPPLPGDRVRHKGQEWTAARMYGAAAVVRRERRGRWPGAVILLDRHPLTGQPAEEWWADEDLSHASECPETEPHEPHGTCFGAPEYLAASRRQAEEKRRVVITERGD